MVISTLRRFKQFPTAFCQQNSASTKKNHNSSVMAEELIETRLIAFQVSTKFIITRVHSDKSYYPQKHHLVKEIYKLANS